jgi:fatty acid desaturase
MYDLRQLASAVANMQSILLVSITYVSCFGIMYWVLGKLDVVKDSAKRATSLIYYAVVAVTAGGMLYLCLSWPFMLYVPILVLLVLCTC